MDKAVNVRRSLDATEQPLEPHLLQHFILIQAVRERDRRRLERLEHVHVT